jgi:hypothetical protein
MYEDDAIPEATESLGYRIVLRSSPETPSPHWGFFFAWSIYGFVSAAKRKPSPVITKYSGLDVI